MVFVVRGAVGRAGGVRRNDREGAGVFRGERKP